MDPQSLVERWKLEGQQPFFGWDFSHLDGRMLEEQPPWSYSSRAAELMQRARVVLDLGTGGGEQLFRLRAFWPENVVATEDDPMPFADGEFDLVLNRHSSFDAGEVARALAPGGLFLTQQVHGLWAHDLPAVFGVRSQWPEATLEKHVLRLKAAGLTISEARDWSGGLSFTDVGAIVYYLKNDENPSRLRVSYFQVS